MAGEFTELRFGAPPLLGAALPGRLLAGESCGFPFEQRGPDSRVTLLAAARLLTRGTAVPHRLKSPVWIGV